MQKPLNILETSWRNQPTINVDEVRNIPFVADPAPGSPVPVPGSIRGYVSDYPAVLICTMSDGTKRIVTTAGGAPTGSYMSEDNVVTCAVTPSPTQNGTTEQPPSTMLFNFTNFEEDLSNYPFEPIRAELRFTSYEYDPEYGDATWSATLFADGVNLTDNNGLVSGDDSFVVLVD